MQEFCGQVSGSWIITGSHLSQCFIHTFLFSFVNAGFIVAASFRLREMLSLPPPPPRAITRKQLLKVAGSSLVAMYNLIMFAVSRSSSSSSSSSCFSCPLPRALLLFLFRIFFLLSTSPSIPYMSAGSSSLRLRVTVSVDHVPCFLSHLVSLCRCAAPRSKICLADQLGLQGYNVELKLVDDGVVVVHVDDDDRGSH